MINPEIDDDKLKDLANYLNIIKKDRNIGFNQLALKAGIGAAVLNNILNGTVKKVNPFFLQGLAKAFRIDYKILYQIVGYLDASKNEKLTSPNLDPKITIYSKAFVTTSGMIEFGEILEHITFPSISNGAEIVGIRIDEDSMDGTIPNKSTVLMKKDSTISDKDIGVFILNDKIHIKRYRENNGVKILTSDNKDYDTFIIKATDDFFAVGKVIKVMYNL